MLKLGGIITALLTPFNEMDEVDYDKLKQLIEFQISSGVKSIILGSTTGEGMLIEDLFGYYKKAIEIVDDRLTIGVTLFGNTKSDLLNKIHKINTLSCQFVLVNTPIYLSTSGNGLVEYFNLIGNNLNKPFIIYYNPLRSGQYITNTTWDKLFKINNLLGVKDASNDSFTTNYLIKNKNDLLYLSGNDINYFNNRILGSDGVISSISNLIPEVLLEIDDLIVTSNYKLAKELYLKYYDLIKNINVEPNPIGLKYLMNEKGLLIGNPKFPLVKLSFNQQLRLKNIYEGVKNEDISNWQR